MSGEHAGGDAKVFHGLNIVFAAPRHQKNAAKRVYP